MTGFDETRAREWVLGAIRRVPVLRDMDATSPMFRVMRENLPPELVDLHAAAAETGIDDDAVTALLEAYLLKRIDKAYLAGVQHSETLKALATFQSVTPSRSYFLSGAPRR